MTRVPRRDLSRRERQIMDIVYRRGRATAAEVRADLPNPPTYSAVRAALRVLLEKELLRYEQDGPRYVYLPTVSRERARRSALDHVKRTFFGGSTEHLVSTLVSDSALSEEELERIAGIIARARKEAE